MSSAGIISSTGLALDIVGVILLFIYGLPSKVTDSPGDRLLWGPSPEVREAEIKKFRRYTRISHIGLVLLITGFTLQLISNFLR